MVSLMGEMSDKRSGVNATNSKFINNACRYLVNVYLVTGWANVNLLYLPESVEIASLEGLTV